MADVSISYKGNEIASMNATGVKTLLTSSAFCEDDITVTYTKPAAPTTTTNVSFTAGDMNSRVYYVDSNGTAQTWVIDPIDPDKNFSATVPSKSLLTATCRQGAPSNYSNCSLIYTRTGGNGNTKYVCIIQAD